MTSSPLTPLAVTGSSGHLGGAVARGLAAHTVPLRLILRSAKRAPALAGADIVEAQYRDRVASEAALEGVHTLFMVSASESVDRVDEHRAFVDAAAAAGVEHIVYTSFFGAAPDSVFTLGRDHYATEQHIRDSGMQFTFLRDNFYLDFLPELAGEDGVIRGPAGDGRVSAVTRDDIAACAIEVLLHPESHRGATYELTGREALNLDEVAATVSRKTGRPVAFENETIEQAYASRAVYDAPSWQVDAWVSTYTAFAAGEQQRITSDVHRLTGRHPMTLSEYLDSRTTEHGVG